MKVLNRGLVFSVCLFGLLYGCGRNPKPAAAHKTTPGAAVPHERLVQAGKINYPLIDSLRALFSRADTLQHTYNETDTVDHVDASNEQISATLEKILNTPAITRQNMDSLLKMDGLNITHSDDRCLWIFDWYENTGGSFKSNISMVYYKLTSGKTKVAYGGAGSADGQGTFESAGASFSAIYKLKSKKDLYLCLGGGIGCNTCEFNTAAVIELDKDSANFSYPAFSTPGDDVTTYGTNNSATFTLGARLGNIERFQFDPKTQKLTVVYLTDDNTPVQRGEGERQKRISRKLIFNGNNFAGDVFH